MTVLHILDHSLPVISGYSTRSRSIVLFQRALGLRPIVLTSPKHGPAPSGREELDGITHYRTQPVPSLAGRLPYTREVALMAQLTRRIAQVARAEGVRVLHAHSPLLNGLPALVVGRRLGIPVVYEARAFWEDAAVDHGTTRERSMRYRVTRALETFLFKRADHVVVIAEAMRNEIVRRGVAAERVTVVPNGVDPDRFHPIPRNTELAHRLGINGGPVLGFIGSFYHYEGLRFLLDTLPALRQRLPGCQVLLVGGGEEDAALRGRAAELGPGAIFAGQIPHAQIGDFYSLIDIFVCPRRRIRLTELVTPLKPLEAMAMGFPVLASDVGGLLELVEHGVTGLVFRAESAESFVHEAARLGADASLRARLGAAARQHVQEERSWQHVVARYLTIYPALTGMPVADLRPAGRG